MQFTNKLRNKGTTMVICSNCNKKETEKDGTKEKSKLLSTDMSMHIFLNKLIDFYVIFVIS
jgi:hypothetical protein